MTCTAPTPLIRDNTWDISFSRAVLSCPGRGRDCCPCGVDDGDGAGVVGHRIRAIPMMARIAATAFIWELFQGFSLTLCNQNADGNMVITP